MSRLTTLLIFTLTVSAYSCSETPTSEVRAVDDTFIFGIREMHQEENQVPDLYLTLSTKSGYPCDNYIIGTDTEFSGSSITIRTQEITIGDICLTAIGPARAYIPLDIEDGNYELSFENGLKKESFHLQINPDYISIERTPKLGYNYEPHEFTSDHERWYFFPENSFALVGGTNTNNTHLYENFLDSLKTRFPVQEYSFPANGVIPYPTEGSGHWVDFPSSYFIYPSEEVYAEIGEFLIGYSSENIVAGQGVGFALYSWKNANYHSWLHDIE